MNTFLQILLGIIFANLVEVLAHKYILHNLGMKKNNFFSHHFYIHHRNARKYNFYDPEYRLPFWSWNARAKEVISLLALSLLVSPFYFYFETFTITLWTYSLVYLYVHKYMHLYPYIGKKLFPWHWKHHMKGKQDYYWGVVLPFWDYILGTDHDDN